MRVTNAAKLLLGATLLVAGFGVLTDGSPGRNAAAQAAVGLFDLKDRQCRHAPTAVRSSCPRGCEAIPIVSAEERTAPTECRSAVWLATCGKACAPETGFARTSDGRLVDAGRLIVTLRAEPDAALLRELKAMDVSLSPRFDGLDRYDAAVGAAPIEQIKKRLSALPQAVSVDFVPR